MNSTEAIAVANGTCKIAGNTDIAGIGSRICIYVIAATAVVFCTAISKYVESDALLTVVQGCLLVGTCYIFAAFAIAGTMGLDRYHAYLVLHQAFINAPMAWIIFIKPMRNKVIDPEASTKTTAWTKKTFTWGFSFLYLFLLLVYAWYVAVLFGVKIIVGSDVDTSSQTSNAAPDCGLFFASGTRMIYELSLAFVNIFAPIFCNAFCLPGKHSSEDSERQGARGHLPVRSRVWRYVWTPFCLIIQVISFVFTEVTANRNQRLLEQPGLENHWGASTAIQIVPLCGVLASMIQAIYRECDPPNGEIEETSANAETSNTSNESESNVTPEMSERSIRDNMGDELEQRPLEMDGEENFAPMQTPHSNEPEPHVQAPGTSYREMQNNVEEQVEQGPEKHRNV